MLDYFDFGATPGEENCAQVGSENYESQAKKECKRFIDLLVKLFGKPPENSRLVIRNNPHDFGTYYTVALKWDDTVENAGEIAAWAMNVDNNIPSNWN